MNRGIIIGIIIAVSIAIGFGVLMSSDDTIPPEIEEIAEPEVTEPEVTETEVPEPDSFSVTLEESVATSDSP